MVTILMILLNDDCDQPTDHQPTDQTNQPTNQSREFAGWSGDHVVSLKMILVGLEGKMMMMSGMLMTIMMIMINIALMMSMEIMMKL